MAAFLKVRDLPLLPEGSAPQFISGSNQIVSDPRRFSASLQAVQFVVLEVGDVGLLVPISYHTGFTT